MLAGGMSERDFLHPSAKLRTSAAIVAIEAVTAVEVVVAVRRRAARHVATSLMFGAACGLASFVVMWFSPQIYDVWTMPIDVAVTALLGAGLCAAVAPWRRVLTPKPLLAKSAEQAAREAFAELGIDKTRGRTGLLVYVALFERAVVLVPDTGIPETGIRDALAGIRAALAASVERRDLEGFLAALARLGPACSVVLPRQVGDENELCDHVA
jgi:putative membrane protein